MAVRALRVQGRSNLYCIWIDFSDGVDKVIDFTDSFDVCLENLATRSK